MMIWVSATDAARNELLSAGGAGDERVVFITDMEEMRESSEVDAFIDLSFTHTADHIALLRTLPARVIFINSVIDTLGDLAGNFVRINGWPGLLQRNIVEAACNNEDTKQLAAIVMQVFNKPIEWVPDVPGFITSRVLSTIINEAYFSLQEQVSSKEEIDLAMKMGTNYPYGPFEWGDRIGLHEVHRLLEVLSRTEPRYEPALLLTQRISI